MANKSRWNSMRFIDRMPEAQLKSKMEIYQRDLTRFERDQRVEKSNHLNQLFRNNRELKNSIASQYSMDDVVDGKVSLVGHRKSSQTSSLETSFQTERQFEAFKTKLAAQLRLSLNGRPWQQPPRPNYADLRRVENRPSAQQINNYSVTQLLHGNISDQLSSQDGNENENVVEKWLIKEDYKSIVGRAVPAPNATTTSRKSKSNKRLPTKELSKESDTTSDENNVETLHNGEVNEFVNGTNNGEVSYQNGQVVGQQQDTQLTGIDVEGVTATARRASKRRQTSNEIELVLPPIVETTIEGQGQSSKDRRRMSSEKLSDDIFRLPPVVRESHNSGLAVNC